jgi:hypothetical protein
VRRLVIAACALVLSGCGVSSQDEPQLIEESTQPAATPSFDASTSPPPSTLSTSPEPTPTSAPGLSGGAG